MIRRTALYPGTFDPVTNGHFDIIQRSLEIFDRVIVGVAHNHRKSPLFSVDERVAMLREVTHGLERLEIAHFDGLVINFARQYKADVILRGLRAVSDFEYELQMALTNRKLADDIETLFLMPCAQYSFLSSSVVKEIARLGGDVACFVPQTVEERLRKKFQGR
jgi:pantetheine-phosphate adenylyltransferase